MKYVHELYIVTVTFLLWLLFTPFLFCARVILSQKAYEKVCFSLISLSNHIFFANGKKIRKDNQVKYDIEVYRDTYDRNGIDLYFKKYSPETIITDKKILDIGCGVGGKDFEFLKYNPKVVHGIDLSVRNISFAKSLEMKDTSKKLSFSNQNLLDIDTEYDTIVSYTVFEHIDKNILQDILIHMRNVLSDDGLAIIVFNHYNSRYGMHLKEYIYHPWPQTIFNEKTLFRYWNKQFQADQNISEKSYFPIEYNHGTAGHNADCFMNLNKVTVEEFLAMIKEANLNCEHIDFYGKSPILKLFPFLPQKYLRGSAAYYLRKK